MCDEREPAVVGDVEPLVRVRRPGVRLLRARREVSELRGGAGPEPERAVDVQPGPCVRTERGDLLERVEGTGVHLACLGTDDGRTARAAKCLVQRGNLHAALPVDLEADRASVPEPEQPERPVDRDVALSAGEDRDGRRPGETVRLHVPADALEHGVASRGETRHVCHLAPGDEGERRGRRDPEQLLEPLARDLLDDRRRRAADDEARVLIPRRRQPVGREGGRERPADDEAEVAPARHADDAGLGCAASSSMTSSGSVGVVGERPSQRCPQLLDARRRPDRSLVERLDEVRSDLRRSSEQLALVAHGRESTFRAVADSRTSRDEREHVVAGGIDRVTAWPTVARSELPEARSRA